MVCIYCGSGTQVQNSRHQKRVNQIWRRRKCFACGAVFTTHETADLSGSLTVARPGSTPEFVPFSRDILFISLYESCKHRPTAASDADSLTQTVIAHLLQSSSQAILQRDAIAAEATAVLRRFDAAAATMYQAYHPPASANS